MNMSDTKPVSETDRLLRDLDKPSLGNLAYALRHPETWPKGFVWNYADCAQCAMGLAHSLWREKTERPSNRGEVGSSRMARAFAIPYETALAVFFRAGVGYSVRKKTWFGGIKMVPCPHEAVTPEMVAKQIDAALARAD